MDKQKLPQRRHPRLKDYDYSQDGAYFVTICTKSHRHLFGTIPVGRGAITPPCIDLSKIGKIAEQYLLNINSVYEGVSVDNYVVMPNHIHLLLRIEHSGGMKASRPTLQTIIRSFKTMITRQLGFSIWQDSFYEHIIRDKNDYSAIWEYISNNPIKWQEDKYYSF